VLLRYHCNVRATTPGAVELALNKVLRLGAAGADLFFVLSGFPITGVLFDTKHAPRYFPDRRPALMPVAARLRHIAGNGAHDEAWTWNDCENRNSRSRRRKLHNRCNRDPPRGSRYRGTANKSRDYRNPMCAS
jgi:hypothetical protein